MAQMKQDEALPLIDFYSYALARCHELGWPVPTSEQLEQYVQGIQSAMLIADALGLSEDVDVQALLEFREHLTI